jgi:hypothetical protein
MFIINKNRHLLLYRHLYSHLFSAIKNDAILIKSYLAILIKEHKEKRICLVSFNIIFLSYPCFNII